MFEEDVERNLRTCLAMAPQHCTDCGDFHLWWALRRVGGFAHETEWDGFREGISSGIKEGAEKGVRPRVLVCGAADSGILKTVTDAAYLAGGSEMVARVDVTVVDHCETPLRMCRDFGEAYGVSVTTVRCDIGSFKPDARFDVIAMHEVLPFFPADSRLDYMKRIISWLASDGRVVTWSIVSGQRSDKDKRERRQGAIESLETFFKTAGSDLQPDWPDLMERLERGSTVKQRQPRAFHQPEDILNFHRTSGLEILEQEVRDNPASANGGHRQRMVIVGTPRG